MSELRIHTRIHSRYQVFDASGQLPFSIAFGLCRRSPADTDSRPIIFQVAKSTLDVPYALANGLLTIQEQDPKADRDYIKVDLSRLTNAAAEEAESISLPSPVGRTGPKLDAFTIYQYQVKVDSKLASILEPEKKYSIRLASEDLGVKRWIYSHRKQLVDDDGYPINNSEAAKLVNSKRTGGKASFAVVNSLPWPPRLETRMRFCAPSPSSDSNVATTKLSGGTFLEVSLTNTSSDSITVQTRGHQHFLVPWGPFQPEPGAIDDRTRIIDAAPHKPPTSSLQVVDSATGEVVRGNERRGTGPLTDSKADRRPKLEEVVTLKPGVPLPRNVDIGTLVYGLKDGQYRIRMIPKGCRWWQGEVGKEESEDGRIPVQSGEMAGPPIVLESEDEVEVCIRDGKVDQGV